jgi:hypothetical protein
MVGMKFWWSQACDWPSQHYLSFGNRILWSQTKEKGAFFFGLGLMGQRSWVSWQAASSSSSTSRQVHMYMHKNWCKCIKWCQKRQKLVRSWLFSKKAVSDRILPISDIILPIYAYVCIYVCRALVIQRIYSTTPATFPTLWMRVVWPKTKWIWESHLQIPNPAKVWKNIKSGESFPQNKPHIWESFNFPFMYSRPFLSLMNLITKSI